MTLLLLDDSLELYIKYLGGDVGDGTTPECRLRHLETLTTIPLGHVGEHEIETALEFKYDQPLWKCLYDPQVPGFDVEVDSLLSPTYHWLETRMNQNDIKIIDPEMEEMFDIAWRIEDELKKTCELVNEKETERNNAVSKVTLAAEAILAKQVKDMAGSEHTALFKAKKDNIETWKNSKIEIAQKSFQCVVDARYTVGEKFKEHCRQMIETAFKTWDSHNNDGATGADIDPELYRELEVIMENSTVEPEVTCLDVMSLHIAIARLYDLM